MVKVSSRGERVCVVVPNKFDNFWSPNSLVNWQWCDSVGRVVASDARGPRFESSHRQTFITDTYLFIVNCIETIKIKKKWPVMAHFYKKNSLVNLLRNIVRRAGYFYAKNCIKSTQGRVFNTYKQCDQKKIAKCL